MSTIAHIRKAVLGISQADLAVIAGVTQATVSRWEAEELSPDLDALRRIRTAVRSKRGAEWDDSLFFDAPATEGAAA